MAKKLKNSSSMTISMESDLYNAFEKYAKEHFIDKSRLVEHLIQQELNKRKKK